jgi:hypothetical protein
MPTAMDVFMPLLGLIYASFMPASAVSDLKEASPMNQEIPVGQLQAFVRNAAVDAGLDRLEVNVIFTNARATAVALKTARELVRDLQGCIRVIQVIAVPFSLPLHHPQISVPFMEKALSDLASKFEDCSVQIAAHLYLSRNRVETLSEILQPNSLVVLAGPKRPWPTAASRIAKRLRAEGHRVVMIWCRRTELDA